MLDVMRDSVGRLWCAVACEPRREPFANANLRESGFTTWWPHYSTTIKRQGVQGLERLPVLRSLFMGYLFAAVDDPDETVEIDRTRGVAAVVRAVAQPLFIRPAQLEEWRKHGFTALDGTVYSPLNAEGLYEPPKWAKDPGQPTYATGESVRLTGGNFAGFLAAVERMSGSGVVAELAADMFGRRIKVTVDACQIERV